MCDARRIGERSGAPPRFIVIKLLGPLNTPGLPLGTACVSRNPPPLPPPRGGLEGVGPRVQESYLVDPASSDMLVSKIKAMHV